MAEATNTHTKHHEIAYINTNTGRYTGRHIHNLPCMCTCIHSHRAGCDSSRYPVTVQVWIVTTAEAIWHLLYGDSDAVLWQHTETVAQAAWTTCLTTLYHLFWMLKDTLASFFISFIKIHLCDVLFLPVNADAIVQFLYNSRTWTTFTAHHLTSDKI